MVPVSRASLLCQWLLSQGLDTENGSFILSGFEAMYKYCFIGYTGWYWFLALKLIIDVYIWFMYLDDSMHMLNIILLRSLVIETWTS